MIDQLFEFAQNHLLLVSAFLVLLVAWLAYEAQRSNTGVTSGEATALVNREDGVIVDIREANEFKAGHIAGAINIPNSKFDTRMNELKKHQDKPVIVVCKTGQKAGIIVEKLKKEGYSRAAKLKGGMEQWQADSLPTVKR
ncbi:rhodanese-like domain-containing protein [Phytohalomonas tamaricis]|uniref:rhodanese-like domain-containing protein n=1 Tax=Phytohalomonas tamaricis TaxID=2081032 RepID=UPI000D0B51E8|nr:rhodanese-like domain-containing protein [Phytohalomonas tamaricis]